MFKYAKYVRYVDEFTAHEFRELNEKCKVHKFDVPYVSIECENESDFLELLTNQDPIIGVVEISKEEFAAAVENSSQVIRIYARANEQFAQDVKEISIKYIQEERDTWSTQISQANRCLSGATTEISFVAALSIKDNISLTDAAMKILAKNYKFSNDSAEALSKKWTTLDQLKAEIGL